MLFEKHKFKWVGERSTDFSMYSNYSADMTFGLVEDAIKAVKTKTSDEVADFIHNHHTKEGEPRRIYSELQWHVMFRKKKPFAKDSD